MPLNNEPPPFALTGLTESLRRATRLDGFREPGPGAKVVGPFRMFRAEPRTFVAGSTERALHESGWRGLVVDDAGPVAIVDINPPPYDGAPPVFSVRGQEAAAAFQTALEAVAAVEERTHRAYLVRFLSFPGLFLTAVWLAGSRATFVPTRIDGRGRPPVRAYGRDEFIALVRARLREVRGRVPRRVAVLAESDAPATPPEPSNAPGPQ